MSWKVGLWLTTSLSSMTSEIAWSWSEIVRKGSRTWPYTCLCVISLPASRRSRRSPLGHPSSELAPSSLQTQAMDKVSCLLCFTVLCHRQSLATNSCCRQNHPIHNSATSHPSFPPSCCRAEPRQLECRSNWYAVRLISSKRPHESVYHHTVIFFLRCRYDTVRRSCGE